jgi:CheY-like chemotaxis protein
VLTESLDLVRPIAEESGIHLLSGPNSGCDVYIYADRQRVKQVLLNLLSNAIKYNRSGGSVSVSCARQVEGELSILVDDTGPGIPADKLDRLFVPFERLGAEQSGIEGSGIGLALSRRLAEVMGGTLDVKTVVGQGSTFTLHLPVVEGPVERYVRIGPAVERSEPRSDEIPHRKIVYVEDNLSNLRLVERLLENRPDIDVIAAMQGRLGLDLVRQHNPDVVLLDLHLPDIDGAEVLRQLREDPLTSSVPVIVVSADATAGQVGRILAAGAYAYLTKPLDVAQLLTMLDTLVAQPAHLAPGTSGA